MNKLNNKIKENFTTIPNSVIRNKNLSDRARFLFCYMASMSDDWEFYQSAMAKELGYTKDTLRKYLDELIETGYLQREQRREKGKFDSYDYTINYAPSGKNTDTVKNHSGKIPTPLNSTLRKNNCKEEKHINKTNNKEGCEFKNPLPSSDAYIVNPFLRQSIHDALNTDSDPKENSAKEKVQREPSETYLCFSAFASTYERLAGVTYPSDKGNYIMTAKDGSNCKKLVTWLKKVSASEQAPEEMVTMFTTAAWQISDKWLKANFTISNIYSQANNIYTKFMYNNPMTKEKRRQEEIDKLVNEFEV